MSESSGLMGHVLCGLVCRYKCYGIPSCLNIKCTVKRLSRTLIRPPTDIGSKVVQM